MNVRMTQNEIRFAQIAILAGFAGLVWILGTLAAIVYAALWSVRTVRRLTARRQPSASVSSDPIAIVTAPREYPIAMFARDPDPVPDMLDPVSDLVNTAPVTVIPSATVTEPVEYVKIGKRYRLATTTDVGPRYIKSQVGKSTRYFPVC